MLKKRICWQKILLITVLLFSVVPARAQIRRAGVDSPPPESKSKPDLNRAPDSTSMRFSGVARIERIGLQQVGEDNLRAAQLSVNRAPSGPETIVASAHQLVKAGKLENAIKLYQDVIGAHPRVVSAHLGLGYAYIKSGDYQAAERAYQTVLTIAPDNADAHLNLGVALYGDGRIDAARDEFAKALTLNADALPTAHFNFAMAYAHEGDFAQAINHYRQAIAQRGKNFPEAHNNLGLVLEALGETTEAVAQFRLAIEQQKGQYPLAHYNLARCYHSQAEHAQAIVEFMLAIKQQPDFAEAYLDLGNLYLIRSIANKTNELPQAIDAYQQALKLTADNYPLAHENLAIALTRQGNIDEARAHYRIAFDQNNGQSSETLKNLIVTITGQQAFLIGNELSRPENVRNLKNKKDGGRLVERIAAALAEYEDIDDELKDQPHVHYCAGRAYAAIGHWPEAIAEFARATELAGDNDPAAKAALLATLKLVNYF